MRYSISNAIPHNPKSKKHPYETLANAEFSRFLFYLNIIVEIKQKLGDNELKNAETEVSAFFIFC